LPDYSGAFTAEGGCSGVHAQGYQDVAEVHSGGADFDADLAGLEVAGGVGLGEQGEGVEGGVAGGAQCPWPVRHGQVLLVLLVGVDYSGYPYVVLADRELFFTGLYRVCEYGE
jgi:hypothetical protein